MSVYRTAKEWSIKTRHRGRSKGGAQGVRTSPSPEMTCGFLKNKTKQTKTRDDVTPPA